jgi:hypothetical protein
MNVARNTYHDVGTLNARRLLVPRLTQLEADFQTSFAASTTIFASNTLAA